jgi:hypothetical protein
MTGHDMRGDGGGDHRQVCGPNAVVIEDDNKPLN